MGHFSPIFVPEMHQVAVALLTILAFVVVVLVTALPTLASFLSPVGPTFVVIAPIHWNQL